MTNTDTSNLQTVAPRKPWKTPVATARRAAINGAISAALASVLYVLTGLDGILGWYVAFIISVMVVLGIASKISSNGRSISDQVAPVLISAGFATVMIPWISLIGTVIHRGAKGIYVGFFTTDMLVNSMDEPLNVGGISHAIIGTVIIVGIATMIAAPLGIIAGLYIVEINGKAARFVRFLTQAMSGVPSIVAGLFIYSTIILTVTHKNNAVAGSMALAILMLPTVARTSEEVLKVVPREIRDASYALGATQVRTTLRVVLPTVRSGLITATILGVARVAGETAPLLLTSQYFVRFTTNIFNSTMASLPTYIFGALRTGTELASARAWSASLVLMVIVVFLSVSARLLGGRAAGRK